MCHHFVCDVIKCGMSVKYIYMWDVMFNVSVYVGCMVSVNLNLRITGLISWILCTFLWRVLAAMLAIVQTSILTQIGCIAGNLAWESHWRWSAGREETRPWSAGEEGARRSAGKCFWLKAKLYDWSTIAMLPGSGREVTNYYFVANQACH